MALVFAVMHLYIYFFNCFFLFLLFLKSSIDKTMEWSMVPGCPSLMCCFDSGGTEGTNSSKILCSMFVYVLFDVNVCT